MQIKAKGLLICPECGKTTPKENKYCSLCGTKIFSCEEITLAFKSDTGESGVKGWNHI